ncbi:hypothetical protein like AT5G67620 [Hibiscus trionum]|uniref:Uncharacterized protein n=1 Tax=Hibiscus trionum TaxID=183268 RepID=A0A9W7M3F6_HIBTR|nr:hypothetical protein like AT5G67620 [Hibiscus trionum]
MGSNPGHYVALVVSSPTLKNKNGTPVKQLKLLKPDDTLLIGHVYRIVSFKDVLKEFTANNCVKLGKLLKQNAGLGLGMELKRKDLPTTAFDMNPKLNSKSDNGSAVQVKQEVNRSRSRGDSGGNSRYMGRHHGGGSGGGKWRIALQSIVEIEI